MPTMPRAFLVKKACVATAKRNWSELKKIHGVAQRYAYKERRAKLYVCEECGGTADSQDAHLAHLRQRHPHSPLLAKLARKAAAAAAAPPPQPRAQPAAPPRLLPPA